MVKIIVKVVPPLTGKGYIKDAPALCCCILELSGPRWVKDGLNAPFPNTGPKAGTTPLPLLSPPNGGVDAEDTSVLDTPLAVDEADVAANIVARNGFAAPRAPVA